MIKRLTYLYSDKDRHGNERLYFKPPGHKKTRIHFGPGTPQAKAEYQRLWKAYSDGTLGVAEPRRVSTTSTEFLVRQYLASARFAGLADTTKAQQQSYLRRYAKANGQVEYSTVSPADLAATRDTLTPSAGRHFLKAVSAMYAWACKPEVGLSDTNPAKSVERPTASTDGYKPWSMDDVLKFKNHHPDGSNARICLALLLFTGWEVSAIRTLGRKDVRNGEIQDRRKKTKVEGTIPVLDILRQELGDRYGQMIWLETSHGKPYSAKSLSQTFSRWATAAGLPDHSAHGLRGSVGAILADLGMTPHVIMSVLRHKTTAQGEAYTRAADRKQMAITGMKALESEVSKVWNKA